MLFLFFFRGTNSSSPMDILLFSFCSPHSPAPCCFSLQILTKKQTNRFGITGMTSLQKMSLLSGGQKSRVAFSCLSLSNPHILVLDEPSNHLDIEAMDALSLALKNFQGGVLMVSHDVTMLQTVCTSLWVCESGTVEKFEGDVTAYKKRIMAAAAERGANGVVEARR